MPCHCILVIILVVLGLRASNGLSALSCVSAVVMHIVAVCLRMNKVDYYYYSNFLIAYQPCSLQRLQPYSAILQYWVNNFNPNDSNHCIQQQYCCLIQHRQPRNAIQQNICYIYGVTDVDCSLCRDEIMRNVTC